MLTQLRKNTTKYKVTDTSKITVKLDFKYETVYRNPLL